MRASFSVIVDWLFLSESYGISATFHNSIVFPTQELTHIQLYGKSVDWSVMYDTIYLAEGLSRILLKWNPWY